MITQADYDQFRRLLKTRSGLVLTEDKHYLLESRLAPVARRFGLTSLADLAAKLRGPAAGTVEDAVVEAMTTNESFFFRGQEAVRGVHQRDAAGRHQGTCAGPDDPHLVRRGLDRPGALFAGDGAQGERVAARRRRVEIIGRTCPPTCSTVPAWVSTPSSRFSAVCPSNIF